MISAVAVEQNEALPQAGRKFKLAEIFAGAGGMAWGAHKAGSDGCGFAHEWVNDRDADACRTFRHNFPIADESVICGDVQDIDFAEMPGIDGLVFGFPCNDFSVVGDRKGIDGEFGGLYRFGIDGLDKLQPLFFVAENVSGLASSGDDLDVILRAMAGAGYNIFPHKYRFEQYGVPQSRHRIIIVGFRADLRIDRFDHPEPTTADNPVTCAMALSGILPGVANNERTRQSDVVVDRLRHIKPGQNAFTADLPEHLKLRMKSGALISQIYKRLKPNEPAYTVTGSGGGGTHIYHWEEPRALTNRERARLQTFPDEFVFQGSKESVRKQIGMAVPPEGAKQIFSAVLDTLLEHGVSSQC